MVKISNEVRKLIAGPTVFICDECVDLCNDIIIEETKDIRPAPNKKETRLLTPENLYSKLGEHVIGQDSAKKSLAVAVYNHYKRLQKTTLPELCEGGDRIIVAPTGSGKTLSAVLPMLHRCP